MAGALTSLNLTLLVTADEFISDFPEFTDKSKYPESALIYWLSVATILLNTCRWGNLVVVGAELFAAHHLVLEAQANDTVKRGGWPGISKGAVTAESAGQVNVTYDAAVALEEGGGHWNLTVYGTRFYRLARMAGAGPIQVGPCGSGAGLVPGTQQSVGWSGPTMIPSQSSFGQ